MEVGQPFQMLQSGVSDLCLREVQALEVGEPHQMLQAGVGDLRAADVQLLEVGQPLQMVQARTGDLCAIRGSNLGGCLTPSGVPGRRRWPAFERGRGGALGGSLVP